MTIVQRHLSFTLKYNFDGNFKFSNIWGYALVAEWSNS